MRKKQGSLAYVNLGKNCAPVEELKMKKPGWVLLLNLLNNQKCYNFFSISGSLHMLKFMPCIALLSSSLP